jgi:hypothetical protein
MCVEINEKQFVLRVITQDNNSIGPGFISETEPKHQIHSSISAAINSTYKKFIKTKTRYSGLYVLILNPLTLEFLIPSVSNTTVNMEYNFQNEGGKYIMKIINLSPLFFFQN